MNANNNYDKFNEWLLLRRYSPASSQTTINVIRLFSEWAALENIHDLAEINYQDAMLFVQYKTKQGTSKKTIVNYLNHIRKYYQYLISENIVATNPVAHIKIQGVQRKIYYNILTVEELQNLYKLYPVSIAAGEGKRLPPQEYNVLSRQRNKVILSLLIHQGLRVEEVAALQLQDLQLRGGNITIHSQRRTAARVMKLESHQIFELMDYINTTRKGFLQHQPTSLKSPSIGGAGEAALFLNKNNGSNFYGITQMLLLHLRRINPKIKNLDQIRASVITQWLKQYDLRKVQYLAGHKYVSSTEAYKANSIDELQEDIAKFHPL